jgi:hypothetical protein
MYTDCRPFSDSPSVAPFGAKVNGVARFRTTEDPQAPQVGHSSYSYDPGTQRWRRSKEPPTQSPDLWRGILGDRNTEGSHVSVGELRELVSLIEPALILAEQQGVGYGNDGFWFARSWARVMSDRDLAEVFMCLSAIKARLRTLIDAGDFAAIDDHVWVSALLVDVDEEVLLRVRRHGNPLIGDGSNVAALRNHIARNRGRLNWIVTNRRRINAGSVVPAW